MHVGHVGSQFGAWYLYAQDAYKSRVLLKHLKPHAYRKLLKRWRS